MGEWVEGGGRLTDKGGAGGGRGWFTVIILDRPLGKLCKR